MLSPLWGSWVPSPQSRRQCYNTVAWAEAYLRTKWHLDPSSRLATIDIGQKWGIVVPLWRELGDLVPHLTQCGLSRGLPPYQLASYIHIQPFGHNIGLHQPSVRPKK